MRESLPSIKDELLQLPNVVQRRASHPTSSADRPSGGSFAPEGYPEGETEMMDVMFIDDDYLETLGMEIVQGRGFSDEFPGRRGGVDPDQRGGGTKVRLGRAAGQDDRPASVETAA